LDGFDDTRIDHDSRAAGLQPMKVPRWVRLVLNLLVGGLVLAYLVWQIDLSQTIDLIGSAGLAPFLGAIGIFLGTTVLMALRWRVLLAAKGIQEPLPWLVKLYFIGYAAGQLLPTSFGGDAVRIVEHARRRPDAKSEAAGAVLLERFLGAVGTLVLVALGLGLSFGRYADISLFYWLEGALLAGALVGAVLLFSERASRALALLGPIGRMLRIDRVAGNVYSAVHGYRHHVPALITVVGITLVVQTTRICAIWLCGKAVGVDLGPLPYFVFAPLLFLVMLVPFTVNGLGVREALFIGFMARFGVDADAAFATGLLFYAVTVATALPGAFILLWRGARPLFRGVRSASP
jgi:uncharacterized membrane protein YbhN (UPF0104 family)